jgi:hypothetical protein
MIRTQRRKHFHNIGILEELAFIVVFIILFFGFDN